MTDTFSRDLDRISLKGVRARGFHGVFDEERRDGQEFRVDVILGVHLHLQGRPDRRPAAHGRLRRCRPGGGRGHRGSGREPDRDAGRGHCRALPGIRLRAGSEGHGAQAARAHPGALRRCVGQHHEGSMTRAALALGANLGDPRSTLRAAVASLSAHADVAVAPGLQPVAHRGRGRSGAARLPQRGGPRRHRPGRTGPAGPRPRAGGRRRQGARGPLGPAHAGRRPPGRRRPAQRRPRADPPAPSGASARRSSWHPWAEVDPGFLLAPATGPDRAVAEWASLVTDQSVEQVEGGPWWR